MVVFIGGGIELSFVDSATSATPTIDVPGTAAAGDIMVLLDVGVAGSAGTATVPSTIPSGFTSVINSDITVFVPGGSTAIRAILSVKVVESGDVGATLTGINADSTEDKILVVFRGSKPFVSVSGEGTASEATQSNPAAQVVSLTGAQKPFITIGGYVAYVGINPVVDPRIFTIASVDAKDDEIHRDGSFVDVWLAYKMFGKGVPSAAVTVDMDDESATANSANILLSCRIEPAA